LNADGTPNYIQCTFSESNFNGWTPYEGKIPHTFSNIYGGDFLGMYFKYVGTGTQPTTFLNNILLHTLEPLYPMSPPAPATFAGCSAPPTQSPTQPPLTPLLNPPTEPPTQPPTEPPTQPPTEPPTQPPGNFIYANGVLAPGWTSEGYGYNIYDLQVKIYCFACFLLSYTHFLMLIY
jgi:hypothetical protein